MFKSILNTLQKNVIGATIFGKLPAMTTPTEEMIPAEPIPLIDVNDHSIKLNSLSSPDEIDHTVDVLADCDPLADPLALDDSTNAELVESDKSTDGQIIFIDVNILKRVEPNELLNSGETETENFSEITEEGVRSDGSDSGLASEGSIAEVRPQISEIISRRSCLKRRLSESVSNDSPKRVKRNIKFDGVNVFYFQRVQGNSCVPFQGGCTLGMARYHMHSRKFSLAEHASEQRRVHRLQDLNTNNSSTDETDREDEPSENSGSDLDTESNGFLQPVPARQRRVMLKTAGVLKVDTNENDECRLIRTSRDACGCNCVDHCDPDLCDCSRSGIQCLVDRSNYPCGCTRHGCDNAVGRVEFDPERIRIHFIHTILRLEEENKQNSSEEIFFKKDMSRQWHSQTHLPDISATNTITDFPHCNYNPAVFENLSHRTAMTATDESIKGYDRIVETMPSHHENSNLMELDNRPSVVDDTLNLHYDYRNDYSADTIIKPNVVTDDIVDQLNYEKLYTNHEATAVHSFNSTFSEFVERTYKLGDSDYQQHSNHLSSSHIGCSSSGIGNSANIENIGDSSSGTVTSSNNGIDIADAVSTEPIPNSNISYSSSMDNVKKTVDVTFLLENDGEFHTNNIINSNGPQMMNDSLPFVNNLINTEIDLEEEIPSLLVNVERERVPNNNEVNEDNEDSENIVIKSVCNEDKEKEKEQLCETETVEDIL